MKNTLPYGVPESQYLWPQFTQVTPDVENLHFYHLTLKDKYYKINPWSFDVSPALFLSFYPILLFFVLFLDFEGLHVIYG